MKVINDKKKSDAIQSRTEALNTFSEANMTSVEGSMGRFKQVYKWVPVTSSKKKNASSVSFRELNISKHDSAHSY